MATNYINNCEETAALIRNFMVDYAWLYNFSNIDIANNDFIMKVNSRFSIDLLSDKICRN